MKLGDVADVLAGVGFPKEMQGRQDGAIPVFKVGDISAAWLQGKNFLTESRNYLSQEDAKSLGRLVPAGATVFAKIGEALRLNRRVMLGCAALVDNNVMGLVPDEAKVSPKYLYYFMQTVDLGDLSRSTTVPSIRKSDVLDISINVPGLAEQDAIVAELETQFSRLDEAVANLQRVKANLKRYKATVLQSAIEGKLIKTDVNFSDVSLQSLIGRITQGWSPKCDLNRDALPDEWAIITTTAVQPMQYLDNQGKPLPENLIPRPGIEIKKGDFLMTRKGPRKRAGVACLVRATRHRLMVCDTVYRFRCDVSVVKAEYLEVALNAPKVVDAIDRLKAGISESGVNLTHNKLGGVLIPLPALEHQAEIVAEVDRHLSIIRELEADVDTNLQRAQALRQATLVKAFSTN
jgi:type I restriction enzyme S subunit